MWAITPFQLSDMALKSTACKAASGLPTGLGVFVCLRYPTVFEFFRILEMAHDFNTAFSQDETSLRGRSF